MVGRPSMTRRLIPFAAALALIAIPAIGVSIGGTAGAAGGGRLLPVGGRTVMPAGNAGADSGVLQFPEFAGESEEDDATPGIGPDVDRSDSGGPGQGASVTSGKKAKSN